MRVTSVTTLNEQQRTSCRRQMLSNVDAQCAPAPLRQRARIELSGRLQGWFGDFEPVPSQFGKSKFPVGRLNAVAVTADPIELIIVRALSMTYPAAQFGMSPTGDVFTAHGNGWTIKGPRIYVTRLSWLLDEAADVFNRRKGGCGGRFYERDGSFFMADGKVTFLEVADPPETGDGSDAVFETADIYRKHLGSEYSAAARHNAPRVRRGRQRMHCSLHGIEIADTGHCSECSKLIAARKPASAARKPWWQFW